MNPLSESPPWARHLPHGAAILLLEDCTVEDEHQARGYTRLSRTWLGAAMSVWPAAWGLELLAQAAACLPVNGRIDGRRRGYLVKAERLSYNVPTLPADSALEIEVNRLAESSAGLNICEGWIRLRGEPDVILLAARFYLWNKGA